MALCLAESLLECEGFDARDQVARYRRWQQEGICPAPGSASESPRHGPRAGARTMAAAAFSGSHDPEALDPEALSRVAPVAMYFFAHPAAAPSGRRAARTTCQARPS